MNGSWVVAPEYLRYVAVARGDGRLPPERVLSDGETGDRIHLDPRSAAQMVPVAALRAAVMAVKQHKICTLTPQGGMRADRDALRRSADELATAQRVDDVRLLTL